jgi:hypothetical protein
MNKSTMTGESLLITLHEHEMAKMGGTVARGETHATLAKVFINILLSD